MQKLEICLSKYTDDSLFDFCVKEIQCNFRGILIQVCNDGLETKYYDFSVNEILITLHQEPMIGITIFPKNNLDLKNGDISSYIEISSYLKNKINDNI